MIFNGQVSQRMDVRLFMSLYSLFNFYVFFLAYLYTPSLDYLSDTGNNRDSHLSEADKERNKIMNEFYSIEMKDTSFTEVEDDENENIDLNQGLDSSRSDINEASQLQENQESLMSSPSPDKS